MDDESSQPFTMRTLLAHTPSPTVAPQNGLVAPINLSTTYTRSDEYHYPTTHVYGRADNPTLRQTEQTMSFLENGADALLVASGMAAAMALTLAFEKPTHILASEQMYYGLKRWFRGVSRFGHSIRFVDTTDLPAVRQAVNEYAPDLMWIETPSNPLWKITDIEAVAAVVHEVGGIVCVDSTVATPIFTQPLDLGADFVMHSATKYLNGHSDVSAGALVARQPTALWARIQAMRAEQGAGLGAFEAWLLGRGLRTLDLRVRTQAKSAAFLAEELLHHPAVEQVLYPGLPGHPGHALATRQMKGGYGGMLSVRIKGGAKSTVAGATKTRIWKCATSLGSIESLIEHRASMEGVHNACPDDLLRLSVGIEDPKELLDDLSRSLSETL